MLYSVRAFDAATAAVREQTIDAASASAAGAHVEQAGAVVLSVRRAARASSGGAGGLKASDIAWWCRELRTLLYAGMTVVEALETMQLRAAGSSRADWQAALLEQLRQGRSLS